MQNISFETMIIGALLGLYIVVAFKSIQLSGRCLYRIDQLKRQIDLQARANSRAHNQIWHALSGPNIEAQAKAVIATKIADRAFNLASSANVGLIALQRAMQTRPTHLSKRQQIANEVAQNKVMETIGGSRDYAGFDWIYPILSDEERNIIDNALEHEQKYRGVPKTED